MRSIFRLGMGLAFRGVAPFSVWRLLRFFLGFIFVPNFFFRSVRDFYFYVLVRAEFEKSNFDGDAATMLYGDLDLSLFGE